MDDHELERAREWDDSLADVPRSQGQPRFEWTTVGARGTRPKRRDRHPPNRSQARPQAPRRPLPRLVENADNEAQYAWRERKPPTDTVRIPAVMVHGSRSMNGTPIYVQLATDCGAFVYSDELKSDNVSLNFGLWGDAPAVAAAKRQILNWIEYAEPSSHKVPGIAKWPKVVSLTPTLRERAEKRWANDIKMNRYRQFPPNKPFGAIGTFHWPSKEFRPEEAFGMSCEALDPIRIEHSCYITYNSEKSIFQVFGKAQDVQAALVCIRKTAFNICSRTINPVRSYLLQWRSGPPPSHVFLKEYTGPVIITSQSKDVIKQEPSFSPRGEGTLDDNDAVQLAHTRNSVNIERVKVTLGSALRKVHYLQGQISLRLRLGMFLLSQYKALDKDELWELKDYEELVKASQFVGRVTEELGGEYPEKTILPKLQRAEDLLSPPDAITEHLVDVRPSCAAEFIFDNSKGDLCLRITWRESSDTNCDDLEFAVATEEWSRLDRDTGHATKLVDMSLTDLSNGSAWQFELSSSEAMEHSKLPPELRHFAEKMRIDTMALRKKSGEKSFVVFNPFVQPKFVRQMIRYQYGINGTDYIVELSQFQDRVYAARKSVADTPAPTVYEPRWGLNVFHIGWETMFTTNARLTIGTSADWGDDMENWFPRNSGPDADDDGKQDGFAQLMRKLEKVEKLVREPMVDGE